MKTKDRLKWMAPLALLLIVVLGGAIYPAVGAGAARAPVDAEWGPGT